MARTSSVPPIARPSDLSQLRALFQRAQRGVEFALLEGPAGVGKDRILREFTREVRLGGGVTLTGSCEPGRAYAPFAQIVEGALHFLAELGSGYSASPELGCAHDCCALWYQHRGRDAELSEPAQPRARRLGFFHAIAELLREVASVRSPLLVVENLSRADVGTVSLVRFLMDGVGPWGTGEEHLSSGLPIMIVGTAASEEPSLSPLYQSDVCTRIAIPALDEAGLREYLQSSDLIARILERTGGLPEVVDRLLEADPLSPQAWLERRLSGLDENTRAMVHALAVLGSSASGTTLAAVAEVEHADLQALSELSLLSASLRNGQLVFTFSARGDADRCYEALEDERRKALHKRCAEHLSSKHPEDAARHALASGDEGVAAALARRAARVLVSRHAHADAARLLERIAEPFVEDDDLQTLIHLHRVTGDYRAALRHARSLHARNVELGAASDRSAGELADLLARSGRLDEAHAILQDQLSELRGQAAARLRAQLADVEYQRGRFEPSAVQARLAIDAADDTTTRIRARNALGKSLFRQRDLEGATASFHDNANEARAQQEHGLLAQAMTNLGATALRRAALEEAEACFVEAARYANLANDPREHAIALENRAVLAHMRGDYQSALPLYRDAVTHLKRVGDRSMLARVANNLGELYIQVGGVERARSLCDYAARVGGTNLPPVIAAEGLLLRGMLEQRSGSTHTAAASFEAARALFERVGESRAADATMGLASVALDEGRYEHAGALLDGVPKDPSPARRCRAALLRADVARAAGVGKLPAAQRAAELASELSSAELQFEAQARLALALRDAGDFVGAQRAARAARRLLREMGEQVPEELKDTWSTHPHHARVLGLSDLSFEAPDIRHELSPPRFGQLVGDSKPMRDLCDLLERVAPTEATVLILGESGTGKELIADALHQHSSRHDKPLVKVNCAALVETLLLSELFGHERGAFTGASTRKIGRFEAAQGGTIFLDEIGDISAKTQVALLRVLQEREFERVGGTRTIPANVRVVAATHRDLAAMVDEGTFRKDLYYRLRGVAISTPTLTERSEDIPALCEHLLARIAEEHAIPSKRLSAEALVSLMRYDWPGNVRELMNVLRSASLFCDGDDIDEADIRPLLEQQPTSRRSSAGLEEIAYEEIRESAVSLADMKKRLERECIARALIEADGNITRAAGLLGMKRPRMSQLVKQYGLLKRSGEVGQ